MCESTKMPATSLFADPMVYLTQILPAMQGELGNAEEILMQLADSGAVEGVGDISSWLSDANADCFFELDVGPCEAMDQVEIIASKIYLGAVVLVLVYFGEKFYVSMQDGSNEQPLLDTRFPDVSNPSRGFQVQNLHVEDTVRNI